jgi:hypothetical protein
LISKLSLQYLADSPPRSETNLKLRQAKTITVNMLTDDEKLSEFQGMLLCYSRLG